MRALITGIGGFAGSHLAEHLVAEGWQVCGTMLPGKDKPLPGELARACTLTPCDITQPGSIEPILSEAEPEVIFHLAAQSSVAASWESVEETFQVNVMGTLALLEAVRHTAPGTQVVLISSCEAYGASLAHGPASEEVPLEPLTPYAASKACTDWVAGQYVSSLGLDIRRVRPFNHIGSRQQPPFVAASFAKQIAEIEASLQEPVLRVGSLEVRRDFTDVRDVVHAYRLVAIKGKPGSVYNVCSGQARSIGELLEGLLDHATVSIKVARDPALLRPVDLPIMVGDASRLREETGWGPIISWEQTLVDLLDYWRKAITQDPDA
ncbi:MAG: GDP-mannose 4,6-dehydratase [bacterium]|nr:GDP-mannose 4,6-dehydratase [bacterium]